MASHDPRFSNQNLGNSVGSRSTVRQTRTFRMYESGNTMKALLGQSHLAWDVDRKQGAFAGHAVYDGDRPVSVDFTPGPAPSAPSTAIAAATAPPAVATAAPAAPAATTPTPSAAPYFGRRSYFGRR